MFKVQEHIFQSSCNSVVSLKNWHRKLAHIHFDQVKKVLKRSEIPFKEKEEPFCVECLAGKQHRFPFPSTNSRTEKKM